MQSTFRSHGLWEQTACAAPSTSRLEASVDTDIAIIGAGYTGLSAALSLAEAGLKPVVLEASQIGFGASGRNVGLVNAGMWMKPDSVRAVLGADKGERLLSILSEAPSVVFDLAARHAIACEASRTGTLHCASDSKGVADLLERHRQWSLRGAPVELLDRKHTVARTGTRRYRAALMDHRAGTIHPLGYARGLAWAAQKAGANIYTSSPLTGLTRSGERYLLETPYGDVRAKKVIIATNSYSTGACAGLGRALVTMPYFNFATAPLTSSQRAGILPYLEGAWDTNRILTSFRLDAAGRLILGSIGALGTLDRPIHARWAQRALTWLFPSLTSVTFESEWWGKVGLTPSSLPVFYRIGPDIVSIAGYNGRGIAPGTVFGQMLAELAMNQGTNRCIPLPIEHIPVSAGFNNARELALSTASAAFHVWQYRTGASRAAARDRC